MCETFSTIIKLYLWKITKYLFYTILIDWTASFFKSSALQNTMHSCIEKKYIQKYDFDIQPNLLKNKFQPSIMQLTCNITQVNEVSVLCKHKAKQPIHYMHEVFCIVRILNGSRKFYYTRTQLWWKLSLKHKREIISWLAQRWTIRIHIFTCFFCWILLRPPVTVRMLYDVWCND